MATTTTTTRGGHDLRAAREQAGVTRAQLAQLAGCSYSMLGNIEQGAVPKRSEVLERAFDAIAALPTNVQRPDPADRGAAQPDDHGVRNELYSAE